MQNSNKNSTKPWNPRMPITPKGAENTADDKNATQQPETFSQGEGTKSTQASDLKPPMGWRAKLRGTQQGEEIVIGSQTETALLPLPAPSNGVATAPNRFPDNLPGELDIIMGHNGKVYSVRHDRGNLYVLEIGSNAINNLIRELGQEEGHRLRTGDLRDINSLLIARAERAGLVRQVWYRVAMIEGGVMIDVGDDAHTRIAITAGKVETIHSGSQVLFFRTPFCLPMALPKEL